MFVADEMEENPFKQEVKSSQEVISIKDFGDSINQSCVTKNDAELGELPVPAFEYNPMHHQILDSAFHQKDKAKVESKEKPNEDKNN